MLDNRTIWTIVVVTHKCIRGYTQKGEQYFFCSRKISVPTILFWIWIRIWTSQLQLKMLHVVARVVSSFIVIVQCMVICIRELFFMCVVFGLCNGFPFHKLGVDWYGFMFAFIKYRRELSSFANISRM